jgi:2-polyprenyl-3-methyl-5-hydroxy-6-metoxy-1,4-benzoquinol methylase
LGYGRPVDTGVWENEFESGVWDHLDSLDEMGHYLIIVGYVLHFRQKNGRVPTVLDIGCGHGQLYKYLATTGDYDYTGIDISSKAIEQAKLLSDNKKFIATDFDSWTTDSAYDMIIFNESLCYAKNPMATICKYIACLNNNGVVIVSMYSHNNHDVIMNKISKFLGYIHSISVKSEKLQIWNINLFEKK